MKNETIEIVVSASKSWLTITFWGVFVLIFLYLLINDSISFRLFLPLNFENLVFFVLGLIIFIFSTTQIIWMLTGKAKVKLDEKSLTLVKTFLSFKTTTNYDLDLIQSIKVIRNKKSNTYWGGNGIRIYDRNPVIISFKYQGKEIEIGDKLENFDADFLKKEINARKN